MRNVPARNRPLSTIPALIALMALAGIAYWFVWREAPFTAPDSTDYMRIAADLRDGGLDELHYRAPGYPFILMLAGAGSGPTRSLYATQLCLRLLSVLLVAVYLRRLEVRGALLALFVALALLPPNMVYAAYVLTETPTEFLLIAGTILLLMGLEQGGRLGKTMLLPASGAAFGLAAIVRPTYQLLPVALAATLLLAARSGRAARKRRLAAVCAILLIPAAIVGAYCAHNFSRFGFPGLNPSFGLHLSTKTARVIERLPDEYEDIREMLVQHRDSALVVRDSEHTGENYIWGARPELERVTGLDKPGLSKFLLDLNLILIRRAPLEYLRDVGAAAVLFWFPSTTEHSNFGSRSVQALWSGVHFLVAGCFFLAVLALLGTALLRRLLPDESKPVVPRPEDAGIPIPALAIPLAVILYTLLVSTLFEGGHQRYRAPTDLLIYFLLIIGVRFLGRLRSAASNSDNALARSIVP